MMSSPFSILLVISSLRSHVELSIIAEVRIELGILLLVSIVLIGSLSGHIVLGSICWLVGIELSSRFLVWELSHVLVVVRFADHWELVVGIVVSGGRLSPSSELLWLGLGDFEVEGSVPEDDDDDDLDAGPLDLVVVAAHSILIVALLDLVHGVALVVIVVSEVSLVAFLLSDCDPDGVTFAHIEGEEGLLGEEASATAAAVTLAGQVSLILLWVRLSLGHEAEEGGC